MSWWSWVIVGSLLLVAELFAVDAQLYLILVGVGAISVGLAQLIGIDLSAWEQWVLFTVASILLMLTVRRQVHEKMRGRAPGVDDNVVGSTVRIPQELAPGKSCRADFRGSSWTAINIDDEPIPACARARIAVVDGLTLHVRTKE
jgi:membrane protein implicated in regulation of membrane protease activity